MTGYLISFGAGQLDRIPQQDRQAKTAGVRIFGGGTHRLQS